MTSLPRRGLINEVLRFGGVGLMTNIIDYSIFTGLILAAGTVAVYAHVISYCIAAVFSFYANRHWTFRAGDAALWYQLAMFCVANVVGLAGSAWIVDQLAAAWTPWGAKLVATLVLTLWFYGFSRLVIFKRTHSAISTTNE